MAYETTSDIPIDALLNDHADEGVFRVNPIAFTDPEIFNLELTRIFESTWIFIGLESEVANSHDYVTRNIGRRSVILQRDKNHQLRCFLNSCRHRGTTLCPMTRGNKKLHVCRYHGWSYDTTGRNIGVTNRDEGQYPNVFSDNEHDLLPVAALESYRGFVFASLSNDVPSLTEHLGDARIMLDLVADQAPDGLEFVPGEANYTFSGNWKLQFENGLDAYHFPATHAAFVNIIKRRDPSEIPSHLHGLEKDIKPVSGGTISFPRGHAVSWSIGAPGQQAENRPMTRDPKLFKRIRDQFGSARLDWMLRQRNLTIFPNIQVIDIQSLQLRLWEPLTVDKTRMVSRCLAPIGESAEARTFRIRQYEEFFNAGGLATSDDNVMYELSQQGFKTSMQAPNNPYARGLGVEIDPPNSDEFAVLGLTNAVCRSSSAGLEFGDETGIHAGYREWHRLLTKHKSY